MLNSPPRPISRTCSLPLAPSSLTGSVTLVWHLLILPSWPDNQVVSLVYLEIFTGAILHRRRFSWEWNAALLIIFPQHRHLFCCEGSAVYLVAIPSDNMSFLSRSLKTSSALICGFTVMHLNGEFCLYVSLIWSSMGSFSLKSLPSFFSFWK